MHDPTNSTNFVQESTTPKNTTVIHYTKALTLPPPLQHLAHKVGVLVLQFMKELPSCII